MNVITFDASSGIRRIQWNDGTRWHDLQKGQSLRNLRIVSAPTPSKCIRKLKVYMFLPDVTHTASIELRVLECGGGVQKMELRSAETWQVDHQQLGAAHIGQTVCQQFSVRSLGGGSIIVDRVVASSGSFQLRFGAKKPPVYIASNRTYRYDVCFQATKPGNYKMPIHVYIRRDEPAGGFNSFIVADTAYITVIVPPKPPRVIEPVRPPIVQPVRPRPPQVPPRVRIETPRPIEPVAPPRIPVIASASTRAVAKAEMPIATETLRARESIEQIVFDPDITDPTTFRTIVLPTARSIGEGKGFVASYDIAGVLGGYGVTDRLTVLAGAIYIPRFVGSRTFDVTAGARYEVHRADFVRVAGGVQLNYSSSDSSSIALVAPYAVVSVGDDDHRASLALSYAARRHVPVSGESFAREAIVLAGGGDIRVARNWKLAAEGFVIEGVDAPTRSTRDGGSDLWGATATVRYFGERFAIDAGALINSSGGTIGAAPVVSFVWVMGE